MRKVHKRPPLMQDETNQQAHEPYTHTITQAAKRLEVNAWTFRAWVTAGKIPHITLPQGRIFISTPWVEHQAACLPLWPPAMPVDRILSPERAAYIAAFLDGEGSLEIAPAIRHGRLRGYAIRMKLCNGHLQALETIQRWIGDGFIQEKPRDLTRHKRNFNLVIAGDTLRHILQEISPYLLIKGPHANIVLTALTLSKRAGQRKAYFDSEERLAALSVLHEKLKLLNKRGI